MAEWLRRVTRNHMGFSRAGSNPACVVFLPSEHYYKYFYIQFINYAKGFWGFGVLGFWGFGV